MQPFHPEEVKSSIFSLHPNKSPGIDGLNPRFYKHYWYLIGEVITEECIQIMNSGCLPNGYGDTAIVPIPKKNNPESMKELQPISLCEVAYKIVANVLPNKLKVLLLSLISKAQSTFIPNRLIQDN